MSRHPPHVPQRVVPPVGLTVACGERLEPLAGGYRGADRSRPHELQLDLVVAHRTSVALRARRRCASLRAVAILIDDARWWHRDRHWCHLVSDASLDELHTFAARAGLPARVFHGDHYDVPAELRDEMVAAGAIEVDSRELVRRLRAAGLRLSPAARRAGTP
jgi:hypothetical protein